MTLKEKLEDNMYEDTVIFEDYSYEDAFVGVSEGGRAIYDYDLMVKWPVDQKGFSEESAVEWIEFNTLRALPYMGDMRPIIMHTLE